MFYKFKTKLWCSFTKEVVTFVKGPDYIIDPLTTLTFN